MTCARTAASTTEFTGVHCGSYVVVSGLSWVCGMHVVCTGVGVPGVMDEILCTHLWRWVIVPMMAGNVNNSMLLLAFTSTPD